MQHSPDVEGMGGPNSNDWREILLFYLLCCNPVEVQLLQSREKLESFNFLCKNNIYRTCFAKVFVHIAH